MCGPRWLFIAALLIASAALAQPSPQPTFAVFGVAEGLPSSWVYAVAQDRSGYLWFGTHDGLARHDGVETRVFRTDSADPGSIGGNDITAVLADQQGRIWAGGEGSGLNRLAPGASKFTRWKSGDDPTQNLAGNDVFALAEGTDGEIWVGLYGAGIAVIDRDDRVRSIRHDPDNAASLRTDNVLSLRMDAAGRLWIGSDRGLDLRHPDGRIQRLELGLSIAEGSQTLVYAFSPEADGGMLVGTRHGVARIDNQLRAGTPLLPDAAMSLLRDRAGTLWVGTRNGVLAVNETGVVRYAPREGLPGFFPGRRVFSILQDHEDGLWFATIEGGVGRLRPHWTNFSSLRHIPGDASSLSHASISAIDVNEEAGWVVSAEDGLDRIDLADGSVTRHSEKLGSLGGRLTAVLMVDGDVWVGHRNGIRILPKNAAKAIDLPVDSALADHLPAGPVTVLRRAPDGAVWAVVLGGGVTRIEPHRHSIERYDEAHGQLGSNDVRALAIDAANRVWLASAVGVERHLPDSSGFQRVNELAQTSIDALAVAADGRLWLHHADGVESYMLNNASFVRQHAFGVEQGLPSLSAAALNIDDDGDVWMSSTRGLWRLRPKAGELRVFGEANGLPGIEFTIGALTPPIRGRMWAATRSGVVSFEPGHLQSGLPPPRINGAATSIRRDGAELVLDSSQPIILDHADRELIVGVRALSFADPSSHRYRFRLDGLDNDWISTGRQGERVFTRLDPGDYQLQAAANLGDGWSALPKPVAITVRPAPWFTAWAYALYAIAALLLIGGIVGSSQRRLHRRHELQLALQRQQAAEQLAQAKSDFLATMSHELRTPLTGVLGMAELLTQADLPTQQQGQVEAIQKSGELLLRLVNDIVDLARIEAGRFSFDLRPFDPERLLRQCIELTRPLADRRGLNLQLHCEPLPLGLLGDAVRVEQILLNLIGNALKFTDQGTVIVTARSEPGVLLVVRVQDSGRGMSPELLARLFQRFEQADGQASQPGGSGLGLAISRELADLMCGSISVESKLGVGSCFTLSLPLPLASLQPATALASRTVDAGTRMILVVEDDPIVATVITGLLESLGHQHAHAVDGLAALALVRTRLFDVILIDLDLPGIHGLQLASLLRNGNTAGARCALLAVSASIRVDETQLREAGMDGFLRKPVSAERLALAIAAALRHRETQIEHQLH